VADGCKRNSEPVLAACGGCGTLFLAGVILVCNDCVTRPASDPEHTPDKQIDLKSGERAR